MAVTQFKRARDRTLRQHAGPAGSSRKRLQPESPSPGQINPVQNKRCIDALDAVAWIDPAAPPNRERRRLFDRKALQDQGTVRADPPLQREMDRLVRFRQVDRAQQGFAGTPFDFDRDRITAAIPVQLQSQFASGVETIRCIEAAVAEFDLQALLGRFDLAAHLQRTGQTAQTEQLRQQRWQRAKVGPCRLHAPRRGLSAALQPKLHRSAVQSQLPGVHLQRELQRRQIRHLPGQRRTMTGRNRRRRAAQLKGTQRRTVSKLNRPDAEFSAGAIDLELLDPNTAEEYLIGPDAPVQRRDWLQHCHGHRDGDPESSRKLAIHGTHATMISDGTRSLDTA